MLTIEGPGAVTLSVSKCEVDRRALVFFDAYGAKKWESSLAEITRFLGSMGYSAHDVDRAGRLRPFRD